jgi:competence protein ComFC
MLLITRRLSRERKIPIETSLKRLTATRQRDASRSLRIKQAKSAFTCTKKLDKNTIYILLDDVVTTGATLNYAAKTLKKNGARTVWAVSLSRQSLD